MNKVIEQIKTLLEKHNKRISKLETMLLEPTEVIKKKLSVKEFLKEKEPKNYSQTTLAIGFYCERYEGLSSFNIDDLECGFRASKEPMPKNLNDTVNLNVKNGFMMECKDKKDSKKTWVLTRSGEDYVVKGFKKTES